MSLNWCLLTCTAPGGRCVSLSSSLFYLNICDPMKKITCLGWRGQAPVSTQCLYAVITLTWRSGVSSWLSPFLTSGKKRKRKETLKRFCIKLILDLYLSAWSWSSMAWFIILKKNFIIVIFRKNTIFSIWWNSFFPPTCSLMWPWGGSGG